MTRVLVTGASGCVGRSTIDELLSLGFEIHAVSRRSISVAGVVAHACDLLHPEAVKAVIASVRPTHLVHLAWTLVPGAVAFAPENWDWLEASTLLAESFAECGGRRIVAAGTYAEYAASLVPCVEGITPIEPATVYAQAKVAFHERLRALAARTGVDVAWCRLVSQFGPHQDARVLISAAITALLRDGRAEFGSGDRVRDFLFSRETGAILARLLSGEFVGAVNVTAEERHSVEAVVRRVAGIMDLADRVKFGTRPPNPSDPQFLGADGTQMRRVADWRPRWSFDDGLAQAIDWWRAEARRRDWPMAGRNAA